MNLANAKVGQLLIPVDDFEKGVAFYRALPPSDPDTASAADARRRFGASLLVR